MATLGDALGAARRSSGVLRRWMEAHDTALAARVGAAAGRSGETPDGYAQGALAEFDRHASAEDWARLTSRLRDAEDPGRTCLLDMVRWRLAAEEGEKTR
jgi:hypothetical protein